MFEENRFDHLRTAQECVFPPCIPLRTLLAMHWSLGYVVCSFIVTHDNWTRKEQITQISTVFEEILLVCLRPCLHCPYTLNLTWTERPSNCICPPHEVGIDNDLPFQLKVDPIKCMNAIVDRSRFRASFSCTALAPSTTISMFFPRRCNMAGEGGGGGGASSVKSASTSSSTSHMSADGEPAVET